MKKIIAVVLTVIMLVAVCPLQSFAFTVKLPTVTELKFLDDIAISCKEIEDHKIFMDETIDEIIAEYEELFGEDIGIDYLLEMFGVESKDELYNYYLGDFGYTVEATLSDGTVHEIEIYNGASEIDRYTSVYVWAEVKYTDYLATVEADEDVVPVTLQCEVFSSISGIAKESEFTLEKELIDCFVKEIAPKGNLPKTYYEDSYIPDLEGEKFVVTYGDGTKKTYTAKFDVAEGTYMLNGEPLIAFADENKAGVWYYDALYEYDCTAVESPYKSIKIKNYTLTEEEGLTSLTLEIVKKNGKKDTIVADVAACLDEGEFYPYFEGVACYDTYTIFVYSDEIIDLESKNPVVTGMAIYVGLGELYSDEVVIEYYEAPEEEKDALTVIEDVIAFILTRIFDFLSLFSSEEVI